VTTASHGEIEPVLARVVDGGHHISGIDASDDDRRRSVDRGVVDASGLVVPVILGEDDGAP
jgi:hypothetical protein